MTKIYVNGVLENSGVTTITNFNYDATRHVIFGGTTETLSTNETYNGIIDNARFYNRVLSAQEISALYSQDPSCVNTTGIEENKNEDFNPYVYPNPAKDNFELGGTNGRTFSFTVTDLLGKEIFASDPQTETGIYSTAEFPNSIYFIKVKSEEKCSVIKLLKE